ncbi:MAG: hypothetical protein H6626_05130 [Pseudobdellovibrionaceae bacterium]|nr:hypothetical protein [Bdellovibrionales bacterium]USN48475.1 MAG: hypothetical protein H6626_05130 [Pseudobdellovibrionaceae bacterium]
MKRLAKLIQFYQPFAIAIFALLFICASPYEVLALEVTEDFSSRQHFGSSELVWNQQQQILHPPIIVKDWDDGGGVQSTSVDVGDGDHGEFSINTYAQFSESGDLSGQVIRINTDTFPSLHFTTFDLAAGWVLQPTGASPLVIRVQGDVVISGTINCSGESGEDISSNKTQINSGGEGRCAGARGGDGGSDIVIPTAGSAGGANVSGGEWGPAGLATGGQGGGGGGGYTKAGLAEDAVEGDDSTGGAGGVAGTQFRDDGFAIAPWSGGSGGGGGSAFTDLGDPANHSSGGGGGAGGGLIYIASGGNILISATGSVLANGGTGGGTLGTLKAGGGGGGAGGSIILFAAGDINILGSVSALHGNGGVSNGGDGGRGSYGRTWVQDKDVPSGNLETPITQLNLPGEIKYETGVDYQVISGAIDLLNTQPEVTAASLVSENSVNGSVDFELAFSASTAEESFTGWQAASSFIDAVPRTRFMKFRLLVNNTDDTTPLTLSGLSVTYNGYMREDFSFTTGCGSIHNDQPPPIGWVFFLIFPLMLLLTLRFLDIDFLSQKA